ncbi:hypothetical protein [Streptomyces sparsogenes]|uniref:hypothetical protein n=1 Tax=Streptomyces sparsogenes TaxID=67365 RepID=UPI00117C6124|nr:hypothetical protein [Streptomyces sparsogenes]
MRTPRPDARSPQDPSGVPGSWLDAIRDRDAPRAELAMLDLLAKAADDLRSARRAAVDPETPTY